MLLLTIAYLLPIAGLLFMLWILFTGDIRKQDDARYFRIFILNLVLWLGFLWASDQIDSSKSLPYLKLALGVGSLAPLAFFVFCQKFSGRSHRLITLVVGLISAFFAVFALAGRLVISVEPGNIGVQINQYTSLYTLQTVYTVLAFAMSFVWLRVRARKTSDPMVSNQVRTITYGALFALLIGVVGGSINASGTNILSPLAITIFAATSFFAIFKHGLFDIRLVVARSIAYVLTLGIITLIFSLLIFGFSGAVLESHYTKPVQQVFYVAVTLALVLTYAPMKRFFDHFTNSIFFRDAYDPQQLLDDINASLVSTIDTGQLLGSVARIICKHLKAGYCSFIIPDSGEGEGLRIAGHKIDITHKEFEPLRSYISERRRKVIFTSSLQPTESRYLQTAQTYSIMGLSRLATRSGIMGFMLLGDKKSGNLYSSQDARIVEIISDELAIAVQNSLRFEEIQNFNVTLQQKVDDATRQLRHANSRLKELDKTKDEFISMASHQLRTPLTTIKGYLSMVLEGDAGAVPKKERDMIQQAFDSAERMVFLIADLLNVSRLQSGKFVIENKPTDLVKLVESQVNQLKETAANHHLTLIYNKPAKSPLLNLDETKIQQVVMNFMDNAIYYTPAGGSIIVELKVVENEISYTVTDTGLGVPKAEQHHLFTKFFRAGNARKARPDGTGLGLFMAKKVITAQGGAIIFSSTEGKGSTFGFSFPRKQVEVGGIQSGERAKEPVAA